MEIDRMHDNSGNFKNPPVSKTPISKTIDSRYDYGMRTVKEAILGVTIMHKLRLSIWNLILSKRCSMQLRRGMIF